MQCLLLCAFRLFLHPLRGYPGPFIARLTDAYGGYYALRKCLHLTTYDNFLKYGRASTQILLILADRRCSGTRHRRQTSPGSACVQYRNGLARYEASCAVYVVLNTTLIMAKTFTSTQGLQKDRRTGILSLGRNTLVLSTLSIRLNTRGSGSLWVKS